MTDYGITALILAFLLFSLLYKSEYHPEGSAVFFDRRSSVALRGFWCLVIVLVHIPAAYQNKLQDLAGSFAYIGVTFFFLTSAYGLTRKAEQNPESIHTFWRSRLPKLVIPDLTVSAVFFAVNSALGNPASLRSVFTLNGWVRLLLACYAVFWIFHLTVKRPGCRYLLICCAIMGISVWSYFCIKSGLSASGWPTEILGFVWGILLASGYTKIQNFGRKDWPAKCLVFFGAAVLLGLAYLRFKPVVFWGDYALKILLGLALLCLILMLNIRFSLGNGIILFLGEISFEIYLVHPYVFELLEGLPFRLRSGVYILVGMTLTIAVAAAAHGISKKILKWLYALPCFS